MPLSLTPRAILRRNYIIVLLSCTNLLYISSVATSENPSSTLCHETDFISPELPIFMEKREVCDYETVPVSIYAIKVTPTPLDNGIFFCLQGEYAESFNITKDNEIKLFARLEQSETSLKLQVIKTIDLGTARDRRLAVNAIQFTLIIKDCNQITWQTILVAILTSICVVLSAIVAIMLILYQQRGLIKTDDDDNSEGMASENSTYHPSHDETFINPRRTSSYEFGSISKQYQAQATSMSHVRSDNIPLVSIGAAQETYPSNSPQIRCDRLSSTMPKLSEITENVNEVDETRLEGDDTSDHVDDHIVLEDKMQQLSGLEYDNEGFVHDR